MSPRFLLKWNTFWLFLINDWWMLNNLKCTILYTRNCFQNVSLSNKWTFLFETTVQTSRKIKYFNLDILKPKTIPYWAWLMKLSNFCGEPSRLQKIGQLSEMLVCVLQSSPSQQRYPQNCHNPGSGMFQFEMWQVPGCCIACSSCARAVNETSRSFPMLREGCYKPPSWKPNLLKHTSRSESALRK